MNELMAYGGQWLRPSAGLATVQWSVLLALAAAGGLLVQRYMGLPKVVGYSLVGTAAGLSGFTGVPWPLQGMSLFLLELGVAVVLFEAGGRIALRWFRHNPMVLVQSACESLLTYALVYYAMRWAGVRVTVAEALALVAIVSSPAVLSRVVADTRAAGPVTERVLALSTLGTLYALTLVAARASTVHRSDSHWLDLLQPLAVVLGVSVGLGAALALALWLVLRVMSPTSENTSILLLAMVAVVTGLAGTLGGTAPLAALLAGLILKQINPRPWAWARQLGTAASLLVMLTFVLVALVAAQAEWNPAVAGLVLALLTARGLAKVLGVCAGNRGSGMTWRQAALAGAALSPMSSVALLLVMQFVAASLTMGPAVAAILLPAILSMEVLGAMIATLAIHQAREGGRPGALAAVPWGDSRA